MYQGLASLPAITLSLFLDFVCAWLVLPRNVHQYALVKLADTDSHTIFLRVLFDRYKGIGLLV